MSRAAGTLTVYVETRPGVFLRCFPRSGSKLAFYYYSQGDPLELVDPSLEVKKGKKSVFVKIGDRWWQPGTYRGPYIYRPTDAPLPYTGRYDLNWDRWVTINGYKVLYRSLPFRERLARARPPWCMLTEKEKDDMKQQVHDYIYLGTGMHFWGKVFHTKEGAVAGLIEHYSAKTYGMSYYD